MPRIFLVLHFPHMYKAIIDGPSIYRSGSSTVRSIAQYFVLQPDTAKVRRPLPDHPLRPPSKIRVANSEKLPVGTAQYFDSSRCPPGPDLPAVRCGRIVSVKFRDLWRKAEWLQCAGFYPLLPFWQLKLSPVLRQIFELPSSAASFRRL